MVLRMGEITLIDVVSSEQAVKEVERNPIWGRTKQNAFILICYLEKQGVLGP